MWLLIINQNLYKAVLCVCIMVKADEKVSFDNENIEDFTEFEYLKAKVEHLEHIIENHTDILRCNNLKLEESSHARYVDEEEVFKALSGE